MGLFFVFASCGSKKDIVYFQDVDLVAMSRPITNYSPTLKADDVLSILVSAVNQDAVRPFNLTAVAYTEGGGTIGREAMQTYLIDTNGNIEFPVLGTLKLAGLNRIQATALIKDRLKEFFNKESQPIVSIRLLNFKVTVAGEVISPGVYTIENERITLLEALGLAGDLSIQARRDNVLVVREENGKKVYHRVNLTSEEAFNSPVYYLAQNDYIYVEPNNSRIKSSNIGPNTNATLGVISTLVTVAALVISITR